MIDVSTPKRWKGIIQHDQDIDKDDYAISFDYRSTSPAEKNITKTIDKEKMPNRPHQHTMPVMILTIFLK